MFSPLGIGTAGPPRPGTVKGLERREGCRDCGCESISGVFIISEMEESSEKTSLGIRLEVGSVGVGILGGPGRLSYIHAG
jgi:hypothetical protein